MKEILELKENLQLKKQELSKIEGRIEQCEKELIKLLKCDPSEFEAKIKKMNKLVESMEKEIEEKIGIMEEKYGDLLGD